MERSVSKTKTKWLVALFVIVCLVLALIPLESAAAATQTVTIPKTAAVTAGKTITLKATLKPAAGAKINWRSSTPTVAAVSSKGVVKGIKAGRAVITAKLANGKYSKCTVTVKKAPAMKVTSTGIANGYIADKYGMRGQTDSGGVPVVSIPLKVGNVPSGTKSYAVYMRDLTYPWVHWTAVNIKSASIAENASVLLAAGIKQGRNDFGTIGYGGPTPPDGTHEYAITVYAMNKTASLSNGFAYPDFKNFVSGGVLGQATVKGSYSP